MEAVATVERDLRRETGVLRRERAFVSLEEGRRAAEDIRAAAEANGMSDMSMEEIDAIIAQCRREWREGKGYEHSGSL